LRSNVPRLFMDRCSSIPHLFMDRCSSLFTPHPAGSLNASKQASPGRRQVAGSRGPSARAARSYRPGSPNGNFLWSDNEISHSSMTEIAQTTPQLGSSKRNSVVCLAYLDGVLHCGSWGALLHPNKAPLFRSLRAVAAQARGLANGFNIPSVVKVKPMK
jgi:hypothetical protein